MHRMSQFSSPTRWKINSFSPSLLSFSSSQWAESCYKTVIAGSDARGARAGGPRQEEGAGLLHLVLAREMDEEQSESINWEMLLRNARRSVEEDMQVTKGSRRGSAIVADPPLQWSEGRVANSKSYLNKAVILLSMSWGTCWAGLFYWEGRSKTGIAARSCPVRMRELSFPQGMAALFVWENQDLSGHKRKKRFQGFKVAAVSQ